MRSQTAPGSRSADDLTGLGPGGTRGPDRPGPDLRPGLRRRLIRYGARLEQHTARTLCHDQPRGCGMTDPNYPQQWPEANPPPSQGWPQQGSYPGPPAQYGYGAPPMYGGYPRAQQGNGLAVAGMVCGIVGLVLFWVPILGWILAILGIVFGGVGIARANAGAANKGMAITGVVLGIVSIALYLLVIAVIYNSLT